MFEGLFQPAHLVVILVIVLIVFGPGKLPDVGKALGKGIREFRSATSGAAEADAPAGPARAAVVEGHAMVACAACGAANPTDQRFCGGCGSPVAVERTASVV